MIIGRSLLRTLVLHYGHTEKLYSEIEISKKATTQVKDHNFQFLFVEHAKAGNTNIWKSVAT